MRRRCLISAGGFGVLLVVVVLIGLTSSVFVTAACGCVTVNQHVVSALNELDALVQQYAHEHSLLYPSYAELILMAPDYIADDMTPAVDLGTGTFQFTPSVRDAQTCGYAVSADRRSHVLLGIGLTERHRTIYLFGRRVSDRVIGYEVPILHPGDTPPEPSPFN